MEGPPLGPGGEDITWPDQVAPRGRKASSTRKIKPQTSNLNMTMIRPLDGPPQVEYLKEFGDIYKRLEKRLEPALVNQEQWKRDNSYLWHEDQIVVPRDHIPALCKWTHESNGHVGANPP